MALQVGVVGAGIAGLGAAIALRRAGHNIEVFERSSFKHEIGAAITMTPNANLILDRWGFDAAKAGETPKEQLRILDPTTLECRMHMDYSDVKDKFGHAFSAFHRVDLHQGLREMAMSPDLPGPIPKIELGSEAVGVECDSGLVKLKDGTEVKKDLIVIADGFNSKFIKAVAGVDVPLAKRGKSVYRTLMPMEKLMADPLVGPIFENQGSGFLSTRNPIGVMWVSYPCRDDKIMNCAVFHDTLEDEVNNEDWNSPASLQKALDQVTKDGFHPMWKHFASKSEDWKCYTIAIREPLPQMARGKVVIIGDAAHPMQPTHAQGGSMALEDTGALEALFSADIFNAASDSVEKRLQLWNQLRYVRNVVTQLASNSAFYGMPYNEFLKEIRKHFSGPLPAAGENGWTPGIQEFFFGYDVYKEAEKALAYKDAANGIPDGVIEHFGLKAGPNTQND